jgi:hypothetical protein
MKIFASDQQPQGAHCYACQLLAEGLQSLGENFTILPAAVQAQDLQLALVGFKIIV